MINFPIQYEEPVFRPPAEAKSAILQATIGCSWNKCAFCEMYTSKKFKARKLEDIFSDIDLLAKTYTHVKKVFLADGDAFVLSANKLLPVLMRINEQFNRIQRIASYALPKDILAKSDAELHALKNNGLKLLYIGIESGDDELLQLVNKGETYESTIQGIQKAHAAGMDTSIMIINGLGGRKYSQQHAIHSAQIINALNPKYLSTLTLSFPFGENHFTNRFQGIYEQQSIVELYQELRLFIAHLEVNHVIYRSNHVSNNLILSGTLSKNKADLLQSIDLAIAQTPKNKYPSASTVL